MNYRTTIMTAFATALMASVALAADTYVIDPAHTTIGFAVEHMVISKVHGKFKEFTGTVDVDLKADPMVSGAAISIKTASVDTGIDKRDEHLRTADFFDATKFPELKFEVKRVQKTDKETIAHGTLTMHGVSKEIALPFRVKGPIKDPYGNSRIGISASTTISRKDYGLTWSKTLETGGLIVGDEVELDIQVEAVKPGAKK